MRPEPRQQKGLTLPELLIAMALFGLISTYIALLIKAGFGYLRQAEEKAELQRNSLFVLSLMTKEIAESSADCIRYGGGTDPEGLVYASPRSMAGEVSYDNGHLLWKRWVCIYWDSDSRTVVKVAEPLAAETTFKPDPVGQSKTVLGMSTANLPYRRVLARNVSGFHAEGDRQVTISLEVELNQGERRRRLSTRTGVRPNH